PGGGTARRRAGARDARRRRNRGSAPPGREPRGGDRGPGPRYRDAHGAAGAVGGYPAGAPSRGGRARGGRARRRNTGGRGGRAPRAGGGRTRSRPRGARSPGRRRAQARARADRDSRSPARSRGAGRGRVAQTAGPAARRSARSGGRPGVAASGERAVAGGDRRGRAGERARGRRARRGDEAPRVPDDAAGRSRGRAPVAAAGRARDRPDGESDVSGIVRQGARELPHRVPDAVRRGRMRRATGQRSRAARERDRDSRGAPRQAHPAYSPALVGTGTVAPSGSRTSACHWVGRGNLKILLDCGAGALHRLAQFGLPWHQITHVVLSHFHPDHWGELPMLVYALKYTTVPARQEPFVILGPPGVVRLLKKLAEGYGPWLLDPGFPIGILDVQAGEPFPLDKDV